MQAETISTSPLDILQTIGGFGWAILGVLLIMSVISIGIMVNRYRYFERAKKQSAINVPTHGVSKEMTFVVQGHCRHRSLLQFPGGANRLTGGHVPDENLGLHTDLAVLVP